MGSSFTGARILEGLHGGLFASKALRVGAEQRLRQLGPVNGIAIVGATCAGKSSVVAAVRAALPSLLGRVEVPVRCLTRPQRGNESAGENVHLTAAEFDQKVRSGQLGLHWTRPMEGSREERYGFHASSPGVLPVYSGNNALYANSASVRPEGALRQALLIGVWAPDEVRAERLRARSADLGAANPAEFALRVSERSDAMLPHVHLVLANHGALERVAPAEVVDLVRWAARQAVP